MRLLVSAILSLSLAAVAFGQRSGGGHGGVSRGGGGFSHGGFGGGVTRGGGFSRGGIGGGFARGGVGAGFNRGGVFRGGGIYRAPFRGNVFFRSGLGRGFRYRWPFFGYYGYPFYGGAYYNNPYFDNDSYYGSTYPYSYTGGYSAEPYVYPYEPAPEPQMVYAPPPVPTQAPPSRTNGAPEYLIAFNDHNIKLVQAYWIEQSNLRYVTSDHEIKMVPLASVDRDLSVRLNHERSVTFNLP